ncbi:RHS repeat-associated core domain-containing protein [Streptomyces griseoincarnatus]|uniref:RHS repeat-associated core domain-containing protein n=1 Tax=Streptomyces griseoincarnatus TaxID=29305 RepID=UPI0035AC0F22
MSRGTTTEAVPQPFRYAGAYADPTGLYKMGHRYYDPPLLRPRPRPLHSARPLRPGNQPLPLRRR